MFMCCSCFWKMLFGLLIIVFVLYVIYGKYLLIKIIKCLCKKREQELVVNPRGALQKYQNLTDYNVFFYLTFWEGSLNGSSFVPLIVNVNTDWAYYVCINDCPDTEIAFLMTIGHELGHKKKDLVPRKLSKSISNIAESEKIFIRWVREVYCDFYGLKKIHNGDINKFDISTNIKIAYIKNELQLKGCSEEICNRAADKDTMNHPSWNKRKKYIYHRKFNEELLHHIAGDVIEFTKCDIEQNRQKELISAIWEFYDKQPIELHGTMEDTH